MTIAIPGNWAERAACKHDTDAMTIPEAIPGPYGNRRRAREAHIARAKALCAGCPVLEQCRDWALTRPDPAYGMIAGGLDPDQRRARRPTPTPRRDRPPPPRQCATCGYSLNGADPRRRYCSEACNPNVTRTTRVHWDEIDRTG